MLSNIKVKIWELNKLKYKYDLNLSVKWLHAKTLFKCCVYWKFVVLIESRLNIYIGFNREEWKGAMKAHKKCIDVHNWIYWIYPIV